MKLNSDLLAVPAILLTLSSAPASAAEIHETALTDRKWCQTSEELLNGGDAAAEHPFKIRHRLIFNPDGAVIWQGWVKDDVADEVNMRFFNCRQTSTSTLLCSNEDLDLLTFQIQDGRLTLDGDLVIGVREFGACTEAENAAFDMP